MAIGLRIGQQLRGKTGIYLVIKQVHPRMWIAKDIATTQKVAIKQAAEHRLCNEHQVLQTFQRQMCIRQFVDVIGDPRALVLRYLDDNLLNASNKKRLGKSDIKLVARNILVALNALHEQDYVHTDVKPDNILVNYGHGATRFDEIQLADLGDASRVDPNADPYEGEVIGAAIFRSPEAMLNLRWRALTDIWSFGATLISLIWGNNWHIFKPEKVKADSDEYPLLVFVKQMSIFGPVPLSFQDIADEERLDVLTKTIQYIHENNLKKPLYLSADKELSNEDKIFICKIMKLDPRERPTAKQLLQDDWFRAD